MNFSPARIVAAGWALIFAALHAIWAAGVSIGLPPGSAWPFTERPDSYQVVMAFAGLIAVLVAFWGRRWMVILVGVGWLIRGLIGLAEPIIGLVEHSSPITAAIWVEPWLLLGGVLFLRAARRRRDTITELHAVAERS